MTHREKRLCGRILLAITAVLAVYGCASTRFQVSGETIRQPLCRDNREQVPVIVLWGTQWRSNQKDVPLREAAAARGIERFFSTSPCFSKYSIFRSIGGRPAIDLSASELRAFAAANATASDRILCITVRELGPVVKLFTSLALIDGGTEVVLDISEIVPATGQPAGSFTAHWQNGGPWIIKGVATLEDDIVSALREALIPAAYRK